MVVKEIQVVVSWEMIIVSVFLLHIYLQRSRDSGGDSDLSIKQQLSSLMYVLKLVDNRLTKVNNVEITGISFSATNMNDL